VCACVCVFFYDTSLVFFPHFRNVWARKGSRPSVKVASAESTIFWLIVLPPWSPLRSPKHRSHDQAPAKHVFKTDSCTVGRIPSNKRVLARNRRPPPCGHGARLCSLRVPHLYIFSAGNSSDAFMFWYRLNIPTKATPWPTTPAARRLL